MKCAKCGSDKFHVIDRRIRNGMIHRRRECLDCLERFNTVEILLDDWDSVTAMWEQKQQLMFCSQVFSNIVQNIVDRIPGRERKDNG